ncbi:MAG: hypothetical protein WC480_02400 [Patescibacteria group bacterium]
MSSANGGFEMKTTRTPLTNGLLVALFFFLIVGFVVACEYGGGDDDDNGGDTDDDISLDDDDDNECIINGYHYESGAINPANSCEECQPGLDSTGWTVRPNGAVCSNGYWCDGPDECQAGDCVNVGPDECSPLTEVCNESADECDPLGDDDDDDDDNECIINGYHYESGAINPANPCEECQPGLNPTGWTVRPNGAVCDNGYWCDGLDECQAGVCANVGPDECDPITEVCDESNDECDLIPVPTECTISGYVYQTGDDNPLNQCEECQPGLNPTGWTDKINGSACNNGYWCDGLDECQVGQCVNVGPDECNPLTQQCDEGNDSCTTISTECQDNTAPIIGLNQVLVDGVPASDPIIFAQGANLDIVVNYLDADCNLSSVTERGRVQFAVDGSAYVPSLLPPTVVCSSWSQGEGPYEYHYGTASLTVGFHVLRLYFIDTCGAASATVEFLVAVTESGTPPGDRCNGTDEHPFAAQLICNCQDCGLDINGVFTVVHLGQWSQLRWKASPAGLGEYYASSCTTPPTVLPLDECSDAWLEDYYSNPAWTEEYMVRANYAP